MEKFILLLIFSFASAAPRLNAKIDIPGFKCPEVSEEDCPDSCLFAHPFNCKGYIQCVPSELGGLEPVPIDCPPGLEWNDELKVCDWPSQSGCQNVPPTSSEATESTETESTSTSEGTTETSIETTTEETTETTTREKCEGSDNRRPEHCHDNFNQKLIMDFNKLRLILNKHKRLPYMK